MARDPGSTLKTSRRFPIQETPRTLQQKLSADDPLDIWKVKLGARSFNLMLRGIARRANVDVFLLNSKGEAIAVSRKRGRKAESLDLLLPSGTYYVAAVLGRRSQETRYSLTLSAPPPTDFLENSFERAPILDITASDFSFTESVGNFDSSDFMQFRLPAPGRVALNLTELTADVNLELYDRNRKLIGSSTQGGKLDELINQRLIDYGSTYYIRINQTPNQEGFYKFSYDFTPDTPIRKASGLQYVDLVRGTGATPTTGQTVKVQYTGTLLDGTVFDTSRDNNVPFSFVIGIGQVIKGWDEGVSTMQVGGRRQLIIPPDLAYGSSARPGIPPNSTLVFDVEVISIT